MQRLAWPDAMSATSTVQTHFGTQYNHRVWTDCNGLHVCIATPLYVEDMCGYTQLHPADASVVSQRPKQCT